MIRRSAAHTLLMSILITGCADDEPSENVLLEQTAALDKAAEVNQLIEDTARAQRKVIDEQGQ